MRHHLHLAIAMLFLVHHAVARLAQLPPDQWLVAVANTNLLIALAFVAIFHLLTDAPDRRSIRPSDLGVAIAIALLLMAAGTLGRTHDVALLMAPVAAYHFLQARDDPDQRFVAVIYAALSINGFFAPLVFFLFKSIILGSEVQLAAWMIGMFGIDVAASGARLVGGSGMRLQMIGACSVFSNLSLAYLGFATVKAGLRQTFRSSDILLLGALAFGLIAINTARLGLMTLGQVEYAFWHHGLGATIVGVTQFTLIVGASLGATGLWRRPWPA